MTEIKKMSFRELIRFYMIDCKTLPGKVIDIFIILLNVLIIGIFVIDTYSLPEFVKSIIWQIEIVTVLLFSIEYLVRLYGSENRFRHLVNIYSIIDILAILPTVLIFIIGDFNNIDFFRLIRILMVFRIFRFLRFTQNPSFFFGEISHHFLKVVRLIVSIFIIFFISSGLFWIAESEINPNVSNFGDAFYFSVVTLTTVGFGDITPISTFGKLSTTLMILSGIILIPWQGSQIIREWILFSGKKRIVCQNCGLTYHDKDASHCKHCGNIIYREVDGV